VWGSRGGHGRDYTWRRWTQPLGRGRVITGLGRRLRAALAESNSQTTPLLAPVSVALLVVRVVVSNRGRRRARLKRFRSEWGRGSTQERDFAAIALYHRTMQTGVSHWVEHMNFKGTFYAYWVMNNVLGQYGIGGRLGRSIRERQGMAYCAGSMFEAGHIAGPLLVRAGVNADNVDRALDSIETEVADMARDGATDDEVSNAKRYLVGSIPRSLETNAGIAGWGSNTTVRCRVWLTR